MGVVSRSRIGTSPPGPGPRSKFLLLARYRVERRPIAAKHTGRFSHVWALSGPNRELLVLLRQEMGRHRQLMDLREAQRHIVAAGETETGRLSLVVGLVLRRDS